MTDREFLDLICGAEREAAALILHARGVLAECKSGRRDVVTEYDRRVQALLVERLSAAVPGARFSARRMAGTTICMRTLFSSSTPSTGR